MLQNGLAHVWEEIRHGYQASSLFYDHWANLFIKAIGQGKQGWIIDCGSGTGFLLRHMSGKIEANLIGLDISTAVLQYAKKILKDKRVGFIQADAEHLPLKDASLAVVTCMGSLHHMPDVEKVVFEIKRVLQPKGHFIFSETHRSWILEPFRMILKKCGKFSRTHKALCQRSIRLLLRRFGFKVVSMRYFGYFAFAILGFPDILPLAQHLPLWLANSLIKLDEFLSGFHLIQHASWHVFYHTSLSD